MGTDTMGVRTLPAFDSEQWTEGAQVLLSQDTAVTARAPEGTATLDHAPVTVSPGGICHLRQFER